MAKNWKEIVMAKEKAREDAYYDWRDTIKAILSDGVERTIKDEDEEKFDGATEWVGSGQYVVDRVRLNMKFKEFEFRAALIVSGRLTDIEGQSATPRWILGSCFERAGEDGLLEKIVWED